MTGSNPKVFFDASVIFSAIYSRAGGSRKLLSFISERLIIGFTSQTVIEELVKNIDKFGDSRPDVGGFIGSSGLVVCEKITLDDIKPYSGIVEAKDAHVIAGAALTRCEYLVTLDKKHLNNQQVKNKLESLKILSPKDLIRKLERS